MRLLAGKKLHYFNTTLLLFDIFMFYLLYVQKPPVAEPPTPSERLVSRQEVLGESAPPEPSPSPSAPSPSAPLPVPKPSEPAPSQPEPTTNSSSEASSDQPSDQNPAPSSLPPSSPSLPPLTPPEPPLPPSATAAARLVAQNLYSAEKTLEIYELFSREIKAVFDFASWERAVAEANLVVEAYQLVGGTIVRGDWAEQEIELAASDGESRRYLLVLVNEDNEWRLLGTIEID